MKLLGGVSFDGKNIKLNTEELTKTLATAAGTSGGSAANPFIKIGDLGKISFNPSTNGLSISLSKS